MKLPSKVKCFIGLHNSIFKVRGTKWTKQCTRCNKILGKWKREGVLIRELSV